MTARYLLLLLLLLLVASPAGGASAVSSADEKLGTVDFSTSCDTAVRASFNRAVATLHSFVYALSREAFKQVIQKDPHCAMAQWGIAMTYYHELWEPQVESDEAMRESADALERAGVISGVSPREQEYIAALRQYYLDWAHVSPAIRAQRYADAMERLARDNPQDDEAQIFFALSLIATASPTDKTHANELRAAAILEPMWRRLPQHPGPPHYLIHAYDSPELAARGLTAARAYAKIAPSAPHALHMPAHIFTRLGLWEESAASNEAARAAAHAQGDTGEELHAMDYLTYAYLQLGRFDDAQRVVADLRAMTALPSHQFKAGYAANVMPVRLAVERADWTDAAQLTPLSGSPPKVAMIVYWARALGHSRAATPTAAQSDIAALAACADMLRASGDTYWAAQAEVLLKEAQGWSFAAEAQSAAALSSLRAAADEEDSIEKRPVTPGPIIPAREQLGELLLQQDQPAAALDAFRIALRLSPGRRGARLGERSAEQRLAAQKH